MATIKTPSKSKWLGTTPISAKGTPISVLGSFFALVNLKMVRVANHHNVGFATHKTNPETPVAISSRPTNHGNKRDSSSTLSSLEVSKSPNSATPSTSRDIHNVGDQPKNRFSFLDIHHSDGELSPLDMTSLTLNGRKPDTTLTPHRSYISRVRDTRAQKQLFPMRSRRVIPL